MAGFLRPYRLPLLLAGTLVLVETALDLARPWPLLIAVDHAIAHRSLHVNGLPALDRLDPLALGGLAAALIVGLASVSALTGYLTSYLTAAAAERIGADVRAELHASMLRLPARFHDRNRTGDLTTRLTSDVGRVQDMLVAWLSSLLPRGLTLAGMLAVLFLVDPVMAAAGLAVMPPLALLAIARRRRVRAAQHDYRGHQGALASHLTEVVRGVRLIQAFGAEAQAQHSFAARNRDALQSSLRVLDLGARYGPLADVLLAVGAGLVLWLGVARVISGRMTVGVLLVVLSYLASMYSPVRSLTALASTFAKGAASRERIQEILAIPERVPERREARRLVGVESEIAFRDVHFAYRPDAPVLCGLDLVLPAGAMVCLMGRNGAGKSTLLYLLLRFYEPDRGAIEVDGSDLRDLQLRSLRERIALVPQEPWIIDGSISDNVALGKAGATPAEIREASRLALVDEFAEALPDGYGTVVGEAGALLSGGQRRRLAIARALLRKAPILLLDEPTSGLDAESEAGVLAAVRRAARGRTVIIVTHRRDLAAAADRVAVLEQGRIKAEEQVEARTVRHEPRAPELISATRR
ncbi:MAG TPA: ABC transporter ATP-binding protein [Candidatus Dormibacteraeota bacterium]|nr:ABC transporter ATP-binding protein [Candidatus Dormibacteraeota bacterium]